MSFTHICPWRSHNHASTAAANACWNRWYQRHTPLTAHAPAPEDKDVAHVREARKTPPDPALAGRLLAAPATPPARPARVAAPAPAAAGTAAPVASAAAPAARGQAADPDPRPGWWFGGGRAVSARRRTRPGDRRPDRPHPGAHPVPAARTHHPAARRLPWALGAHTRRAGRALAILLACCAAAVLHADAYLAGADLHPRAHGAQPHGGERR